MSYDNVNKDHIFNGTDYSSWRELIRAGLISKGLKDVLNEFEGDVNAKTAYNEKEEKAYFFILERLSREKILEIRGLTRPVVIFEKLDRTYQRKGDRLAALVQRKLASLKYNENQSMRDHLATFDRLIADLRDAGVNPEESYMRFTLLETLPASYENLRIAINCQTNGVTTEYIKEQLLTEDDYRRCRGSFKNSLNPSHDTNGSNGNFGKEALFTRRNNYHNTNSARRGQVNNHHSFNSNAGRHHFDANYHVTHDSENRPKCFRCNKFGHIGRYCRQSNYRQKNNYVNPNKDGENDKRSRPNDEPPRRRAYETTKVEDKLVESTSRVKLAFSAVRDEDEADHTPELVTFILDSGSSDHLVGNRNLLHLPTAKPVNSVIGVAKKEQAMNAELEGTVNVTSEQNGIVFDISINEVLYVPDLKNNLLSFSKLMDHGFTIRTDGESKTVQIWKNELLVCTGIKQNGVIVIQFKLNNDVSEQERNLAMNVTNVNADDDLLIWHARMGHLNFKYLQDLTKMAAGVPQMKLCEKKPTFCPVCAEAKMKRKSCKEVRHRASRLLEIIHTDLIEITSQNQEFPKQWVVTFLDDYSHFACSFVITRKFEVHEKFVEYLRYVKNKHNLSVSTLRADNGGEFNCNSLKELCQKEGIQLQFAEPYVHQHNGKIEKYNQTVMNVTRSLLYQSGFPASLWPYALRTAVYLLNRSPTSTLNNMTPYELWYGRKPNLKNLKIFGCLAYVYDEALSKNKLQPRSKMCFLIGFTDTGYVFYDNEKKQIIPACTAVFDEKQFYGHIERNAKSLSQQVISSSDVDTGVNDDNEKKVSESEKENLSSTPDVVESSPTLINSDEVTESQNENLDEQEVEVITLGVDDIPDVTPVAYNVYAEAEIPHNFNEAVNGRESQWWKDAIKNEILALERNKTFEEIERKGIPPNLIIDSRWVFAKKIKYDGAINYKARLVARGFKDQRARDISELYSPVPKLEIVRMLLILANRNSWSIIQLDVTAAFLNGTIAEEIYLEIPDGVLSNTNKVWRLKKSLYGLKTAAKCWYKTLQNALLGMGLMKSDHESCLYIKHRGNLVTVILVYVDDMILTGNDEEFMESVKLELMKKFEIKEEGEPQRFLGLEVERDKTQKIITLNQTKYIENVTKRFLKNVKKTATPMETNLKLVYNKSEKKSLPFRELIGALSYISHGTRPDVMFSVNYLSRFQSSPTKEMYAYATRILKYLYSTKELKLIYGGEGDRILEGYVDADYAADINDRRSTTGMLVLMYGDALTWNTKKQRSVTSSTAEAEYVALASMVNLIRGFSNIIHQVLCVKPMKVQVFEDNTSAIKIATTETTRHTRHIAVQTHITREACERKEIEIKYIPSKEQLADLFTKALKKDDHERLTSRILGYK